MVLFKTHGCILLKDNEHLLNYKKISNLQHLKLVISCRIMGDAKRAMTNLARIEHSIGAFYLHSEITFFFSLFQTCMLVFKYKFEK